MTDRAQRAVGGAGPATVTTAGFVDAHVHTTATGLALGGLDLHDARSLADLLGRVEAAARAGRGRVILGTGWDDTGWPERRPPTRQELDRAAYGGAVYLARVDVHSAVVSSALLAAAPDAQGAEGFHGSGHVRLEAHHAVRRAAYASITPDQRRAAQRRARAHAAGLGIACLQEMSGPEVAGRADLEALLDLARTEVGPTVLAYWGELDGSRGSDTGSGDGGFGLVAELGLVGAGGDLFCDGSLGSHTAALRRPYTDAPTSGHLRYDDEQIVEHVRTATAAGVQAGFHVIGDEAIDQVVRAVEAVAVELGVGPVRAARHRLEHAELPRPDHIATMARLGMVASVQPAFDAAWGGTDGMYATRLGTERAAALNPLSAYAAAGVSLVLGSDAPVTALDPWGGVAAAVAHRTPGAGLTVGSAMHAATVAGWAAARVPDPGSEAVWDCPSYAELLERGLAGEPARCLRLSVSGTVVYDVEGAA